MSLPPEPIELLGAFESTYQPAHDRDVVETTQHDVRWREDLDLLRAAGVRRLRYPIRWHRVEPEPGRFDWRSTDAALGHMRHIGLDPIVDLLHHTSYPAWVGDLGAPGFAPAFLRFVEAVAERYPWLGGYTVCNEPLSTFLLCGELGIWPPHSYGIEGLVQVATNVFPAVLQASRLLHDALPHAEHLHVEVCEHHTSSGDGLATAELANDRRWFFTDLLAGHDIDPDRPYVRVLREAGGEALLDLEPGHVDVIGLDYYAHNQWHWTGPWQGTSTSPSPRPLSELLAEGAARYGLPVAVGETNLCGYASDRASWFKHVLEQCEIARDAGIDVRGLCWFPFIDSADWASVLVDQVGAIDPVGVYWLDDRLDRRPSTMSRAFTAAATGAGSRQLTAYRFRPPAAEWLEGWGPHLAHWDWVEPPGAEPCSNRMVPGQAVGLTPGARSEP